MSLKLFCALFCISFTSPLIRTLWWSLFLFATTSYIYTAKLSEVNFIISPWEIGSPPFYNQWWRRDISDILISFFFLPRLKKTYRYLGFFAITTGHNKQTLETADARRSLVLTWLRILFCWNQRLRIFFKAYILWFVLLYWLDHWSRINLHYP